MKGDSLLTLAMVADRYAISTRQLRRWMAKGDGSAPPPCRMRPYRFRASDVDAHMARLTVAGSLRRAAQAARRTA